MRWESGFRPVIERHDSYVHDGEQVEVRMCQSKADELRWLVKGVYAQFRAPLTFHVQSLVFQMRPRSSAPALTECGTQTGSLQVHPQTGTCMRLSTCRMRYGPTNIALSGYRPRFTQDSFAMAPRHAALTILFCSLHSNTAACA